MIETGKHLKKLAQRSGYSVKDIQQYLNLSCPQPVYRWYKGDILPSVDNLLFLLKKMMHDKYDYIEYFIYELDYGRKYEAGMITDESGQDIDIHTSELLYDFISNNGVICGREV